MTWDRLGPLSQSRKGLQIGLLNKSSLPKCLVLWRGPDAPKDLGKNRTSTFDCQSNILFT